MNFLAKMAEMANDGRDAGKARICHDLLSALHEGGKLDVALLYDLPYDDFQTAIEALKEWRLQRYWDGQPGAADAAGAARPVDFARVEQRPA